jgi:homoserine kinase type II
MSTGRTKMAIFTKLNKNDLLKLLKHYPEYAKISFSFKGIGLGTVNTYYRLSFKNGDVCFLKIDEVADENRLKNEILVFKNLKECKKQLSFDFPFPILTKDNKYYFKLGKKFVLLFPELPGASIYTHFKANHYNQIGAKIAELHSLKIKFKIKNHRFNLAGLKKSFSGIKVALQKIHPDKVKSISKRLKNLSTSIDKKQKLVLIHADMFAENIHWTKNKLTGILDYEAAGLGHPLFDICIALHALCHDGRSFDVKSAKALLKGYQSKKTLPLKLKKQINAFMEFTAIRLLITRLKDFEIPGTDPKAEHFKDYREMEERLIEIDEWNTANRFQRLFKA